MTIIPETVSPKLMLYLTDKQIIKEMGVGINSGRKALQQMRLHPKFPGKNLAGKRYWPSVRAFLDVWNGLTVEGAGKPAGQEDQHEQTPYRGRAWANLEASKERLRRRVARVEKGLPAEEPSDCRVHEGAD